MAGKQNYNNSHKFSEFGGWHCSIDTCLFRYSTSSLLISKQITYLRCGINYNWQH